MSIRTLISLNEAKEEVQKKLKEAELAGDWMVGIWHKNTDGKLMFHRISFTFADELSEHALFLLAQDLTQNRMRNTVAEPSPLKKITLHKDDPRKGNSTFLGMPVDEVKVFPEVVKEEEEKMEGEDVE